MVAAIGRWRAVYTRRYGKPPSGSGQVRQKRGGGDAGDWGSDIGDTTLNLQTIPLVVVIEREYCVVSLFTENICLSTLALGIRVARLCEVSVNIIAVISFRNACSKIIITIIKLINEKNK